MNFFVLYLLYYAIQIYYIIFFRILEWPPLQPLYYRKQNQEIVLLWENEINNIHITKEILFMKKKNCCVFDICRMGNGESPFSHREIPKEDDETPLIMQWYKKL